jgi:[ribosomal protein S5]-alanine N-acetyltransferase
MEIPQISLPIETEHLVIRQTRASDGDARFELHSDPEYVRFIGRPIDRERCDTELDRELRGEAELFSAAISLRHAEPMIGECVLVPSTVGEVELVIALLARYRRSGYGFEVASAIIRAALADARISTVIACVEDENEASKRLVQSLGMVRDGIMPRADGAMPRRFEIRKVSA